MKKCKKISVSLISLLFSFSLQADTASSNDTRPLPLLDSPRIISIFEDFNKVDNGSDYFINEDKVKEMLENKKFEIPSLSTVIPESTQKIIRDRKLSNMSKGTAIDFSKYPSEVDLRTYDSKVKSQFGGTCTAFGLMGAVENFINKNFLIPESDRLQTNLSERHFWSMYKVYSAETALGVAQKNYVTEDKYWPETYTKPFANYLVGANTKVIGVKSIDDSIELAVNSLSRGNPIYLATSTSKGMVSCASVINPTSPATNGGHAVPIVGYKLDPKITGGGYFIIKNSWGNDCGDGGYQYVPFNHCLRSDMYCIMWEIRGVETNLGVQAPTIVTPESIIPTSLYTKTRFDPYYHIKLSLNASRKVLKEVESVTYTVFNSSLGTKILPANEYLNNFAWNIKSKNLNQQIKIEIRLKNQEIITKSLIVK